MRLPLGMRFIVLAALALTACAKPFVPNDDVDAGDKTNAVEIHASPKLTSIESSMTDGLGRPVRVACVTCHAVRDAGAGFPESASALKEFHAGLTVQHGTLSCGACHVAGGKAFESKGSCAKCHVKGS